MRRILAVLVLLTMSACEHQFDISIVVPVEHHSSTTGDNLFHSVLAQSYDMNNFAVAGSDDIAIADFNADSQLDVVVTHRHTEVNAVYLNIGKGKHTMSSSLKTKYVTDVDCGDINADGFEDIVLMNSRYHPVIRFGVGDGGFAVSQFSDPSMNCVAIGDLDGNGFDDVVVGGPEGLEIWWSSASDFSSDKYLTGDVQHLLCEDINRDGRIDIIASEVGKQWIRINKGDGVFEEIEIGSYSTTEMQTGDLNNDGNIDLFFANSGEPSVVLLQQTEFSFHSLVVGPEVLHADGCCLVDFDQDGLTDIIVTNVETQTQTLFHNSGTWFSKHQRLGNSTRTIATGDLNNDGKPDLILANSKENMNEIWLSK